MKLLWCYINTDILIPQFLTDFRNAVANFADVVFLEQPASKSCGWAKYQNLILNGEVTPPYLLENICDKHGTDFDFIIFESLAAFKHEPLHLLKHVPKGIFKEDVHPKAATVRWLFCEAPKQFDISTAFITYRDSFKNYWPDFYKNYNTVWLPYSVDTTRFKPLDIPKKIDILKVGVSKEDFYPIRYRIAKELKGYPNFMNAKFTAKGSKPWPVGEDYIKLLNKAVITATCSTIHHYVVCKYFEIPACNSLLYATWEPEMEQLGFIPDENMIIIDPNNIKPQIKSILDNKEKIEKISACGVELVHKYHSMDIRAKQLINSICKIIGKPDTFSIEHDYTKSFAQ